MYDAYSLVPTGSLRPSFVSLSLVSVRPPVFTSSRARHVNAPINPGTIRATLSPPVNDQCRAGTPEHTRRTRDHRSALSVRFRTVYSRFGGVATWCCFARRGRRPPETTTFRKPPVSRQTTGCQTTTTRLR